MDVLGPHWHAEVSASMAQRESNNFFIIAVIYLSVLLFEYVEEFDFEDECGVGRYAFAGAAGAVGEVVGDVEAPFGAYVHEL